MPIRPFGYRVTLKLLEESESGLVVVRDSDSGIKRGIIIEIGHGEDDDEDYPELRPGNIVHFSEGYQIGELWIVDMCNIIAYEPLTEDDREEQPGWTRHTT